MPYKYLLVTAVTSAREALQDDPEIDFTVIELWNYWYLISNTNDWKNMDLNPYGSLIFVGSYQPTNRWKQQGYIFKWMPTSIHFNNLKEVLEGSGYINANQPV